MKKYRIAPEVKDQVLGRIKNDVVSVKDVAKDHGISTHTIHIQVACRNDKRLTDLKQKRRESMK